MVDGQAANDGGGGVSAAVTQADVVAAVSRALEDVPDPCMVAAGAEASIVELGLVDAVSVVDGCAEVEITLTEPGCPFTHHIVAAIHDAAEDIEGIDRVRVLPRWAPMWSEERLAPEGRAKLENARRRMALARAQRDSA